MLDYTDEHFVEDIDVDVIAKLMWNRGQPAGRGHFAEPTGQRARQAG